jgi:formyl-CoA transferase
LPQLGELQVLDITDGMAGPLTTQLLSDYAPRMLRVDPPGAVRGRSDLVRMRGLRSICIDHGTPEGIDLIEHLVARADVLLLETALDSSYRYDAPYQRLASLNPRLVLCRISGHGDEGPLARSWVHDHLVAARYGVQNQPGWREGPTFLTANVPSLGAALLAVQAIGTALYVRERTGRGQEVATSLLGGALSFQPGLASATNDRPMTAPSLVGRSPLGFAPLYSLYECADHQWLHLGCLTVEFQRRAIDALDLEARMDELGFFSDRVRENNEAIVEAIAGRMRQRSYAEWSGLLQERDIPHALSQWTEDLLDDPQVRHERLLVSFDDPAIGPVEAMAYTIAMGGLEWKQPEAAPLVGQHTDEVCRELGLAPDRLQALRQSGVLA